MGFHRINPLAIGVLILYAAVFSVHAYNQNPGETYPMRVEVAVGASFNISCHMNPEMFPGHSARDLYFRNVNTKERVPDTEIYIANATTIIYMLHNAVEQQNQFICKCGPNAIMDTKVFVGKPPLRVTDFACRSYNFEYMLCNFTQPWNPLLTQYNLTFHLKSSDYSFDPACNYDDKPVVVCNITSNYHAAAQFYRFTLRSSNALGNESQHFVISNRDVMVPAAPGHDFRLINLTPDAMTCAWSMPINKWELYGGSRGLVWEVLLQPQDFPTRNLSSTVRIQRSVNGELLLHLHELPYAWWWYELRVRVRVRERNSGRNNVVVANDELMWSTPFVYRFRTEGKVPARPPYSTPGAFFVDSMETSVRIYWEQLKEHEYNGDNFTYFVDEVRKNGKSIQLAPLELEANSAVFAFERDAHYEYTIRSRNHLGDSAGVNVIRINPLTQHRSYLKTHSPKTINNVYSSTNYSYTLSWQAPTVSEGLRDYTVYWCNSKRATLNECKGSIHFRTLSSTTHKFNTDPQAPDQEHSLNLAVSANYKDGYNTGMHWTACNQDVTSDLIKMEPDVYVNNATAIQVQWSPEGVCPSVLAGYNLTICEVNSDPMSTTTTTNITTATTTDNAAACLDTSSLLRYTINVQQKKYVVGHLKPFTQYRVEMFMFSHVKNGKPSDPLYVRTAESAPTPPRQLQVSHVTNSTAIITWMPPSRPNGHLKPYIVTINNLQIEVSADEADPTGKMMYKLDNLYAFTSYKVYVVARTVNTSEPSNDIHFTTPIGYPAMPGIINSLSINDTEYIHWRKPEPAAGKVDFYEIAVTQKLRDGDVVKRRISTLLGATTTTCALRTPICLDPDHETTIEVRAVNAASRTNDDSDNVISPWNSFDDVALYAGNDELSCLSVEQNLLSHNANEILARYRNATLYRLYNSPWLTAKTIGCHANRISEITIIALAVVMMSLGVMAALYVARKQYNKMANIHCTLPAGLDTAYVTKDGTGPFSDDFVSTVEEEEMSQLQRSQDFVRHNEKYHLLASLAGNDSGYLGDGSSEAERRRPLSTNMTNANVAKQTGGDYLRTHSESSADSLVGSTNSTETIEATAATADERLGPESFCNVLPALMPLQRIVEDDYVAAPAPSMPQTVHSGYINPTQMLNWQLQAATETATATKESQSTPTPSASSGYVSVDSLQATPKSMNNTAATATAVEAVNLGGYVLPSEIHKITAAPMAESSTTSPPPAQNPLPQITNLSGYTTLAELSKISTVGIELPEVTLSPPLPLDNLTIGGYVTPRELSVFGQHQQQSQRQPQFN